MTITANQIEKVNAIEVSGKAYFCDGDKVVHRLLSHFGIEVNRVAVRP